MKKQAENDPLDDLFARKLGNMSLEPSASGFERLQARMGHQNTVSRVVFWRNQTLQRYMVAAACLLLVCLIGWFYQSSNSPSKKGGAELIADKSEHRLHRKAESRINKTAPEVAPAEVSNSELVQSQLATTNKPADVDLPHIRRSQLPNQPAKESRKLMPGPTEEQPVLAQVPTGSNVVKPASPIESIAIRTSSVTPERLTGNYVKQAPLAERVLVVTIAEPEALAEARQIAKTAYPEKSVVSTDTKPEKETKAGGLWQQVKRIKQGDVFARRDAPNGEDQGLIGRAYSGLKQSFDKDKSDK